MSRKVIQTEKAPKAIGPYSQAIRTDFAVYTAGQVGMDPSTGNLVSNDIEEQTRQALQNLENVLQAAGSSISNVVKTTVFLQDMNDFAKMNSIYAEFFGENPHETEIAVFRGDIGREFGGGTLRPDRCRDDDAGTGRHVG